MDQFVGKGEIFDTDENIEFGEHQINDEVLRRGCALLVSLVSYGRVENQLL